MYLMIMCTTTKALLHDSEDISFNALCFCQYFTEICKLKSPPKGITSQFAKLIVCQIYCVYGIVLYENVLYVEVMYYFTEQVDFKISSKLIQASKG